MEIVLLPSLIAIALKISIFMRYHESLHRENLSLGLFFLAAFSLNLVELITLNQNYSHSINMSMLLAYYVSAIFIMHAFVNLALQYSEFRWHVGRIKFFLNLLLGLLTLGVILSRSIIADVQTVEFSITKIAGPNYWMFQVYAIGSLLFALSLLIHGIRRARSNISKQQSLILLLSTSMPILVTFGVIGLQAFGVQITSALFMSLALTFMVAIIVYAEEKTRLFRMLTLVPLTKERRLHKQLMKQLSSCISLNEDPTQEKSLNLKHMMRDFEGLVIDHMLDYYEGNQKLTASALGVSEATLSRRARAGAQQKLSRQIDSIAISSSKE